MMEHVQSHARLSEPAETGMILDWSDMKDQHKYQLQWKWPNNSVMRIISNTGWALYVIDFVIKYPVEKNEENMETIYIVHNFNIPRSSRLCGYNYCINRLVNNFLTLFWGIVIITSHFPLYQHIDNHWLVLIHPVPAQIKMTEFQFSAILFIFRRLKFSQISNLWVQEQVSKSEKMGVCEGPIQ